MDHDQRQKQKNGRLNASVPWQEIQEHIYYPRRGGVRNVYACVCVCFKKIPKLALKFTPF